MKEPIEASSAPASEKQITDRQLSISAGHCKCVQDTVAGEETAVLPKEKTIGQGLGGKECEGKAEKRISADLWTKSSKKLLVDQILASILKRPSP